MRYQSVQAPRLRGKYAAPLACKADCPRKRMVGPLGLDHRRSPKSHSDEGTDRQLTPLQTTKPGVTAGGDGRAVGLQAKRRRPTGDG